jgi:hypothetical protein
MPGDMKPVHRWRAAAAWLDARLMEAPRAMRAVMFALTGLLMIVQGLPHVPRVYVDYSHIGALRDMSQPDTWGTDTIADMYESKVILHDVRDMYTKTGLAQTPLEAATWSKPASAPYPPVALLAETALYVVGERTGLRFYGMVLLLAAVFLSLSARYFWTTRWYLFPALYLNFSYLGFRFVYVQDGTYLVMLVLLITALFLARRGHAGTHAIVALATDVKLTPLYYVKNLPSMPRRAAIAYVAILGAGLALPFLIWENYGYIYRFNEGVKGDTLGLVAALGWGLPFAALLGYVEARLGFDLEDRVGWGLVPFGMFLAMKMNVPRHLLMALLIPDKRGLRNLVAAVPLALATTFPGVFRFGSLLSMMTVLLFGVVFYYLHAIGWATIRDDLRHPARTAGLIFGGR